MEPVGFKCVDDETCGKTYKNDSTTYDIVCDKGIIGDACTLNGSECNEAFEY